MWEILERHELNSQSSRGDRLGLGFRFPNGDWG